MEAVKDKSIQEKKTNMIEEIEIPEGINVSIENDVLIMKKEDKKLKRKLNSLIGLKVEAGKITIKTKTMKKNEKKIYGTMRAHINNMIKGLTEGFLYKLQIASVHFPITTEIDKANNEFVVKNFLGEKKDRRIKLIEGVEVKVSKDIIEVSCYDIEKAGQVAANLEKGAKVRGKDRRIFQDGIYIIEKPRRVFLE